MSKLIATANAIVDITTAQTVVSAEWSHADRITEGKQPDVVVVKTIAEAVTADARFTVTLIETREAAANPVRRARVISEATAGHAARIAEYAAQPEVEAPKAMAAAAPKAPAKPRTTLPVPSSNNDEIAKALVRVADATAPEAQKSVQARLQELLDGYVAQYNLSTRRGEGLKSKLAALGHTI
jgi:hypothetical protein